MQFEAAEKQTKASEPRGLSEKRNRIIRETEKIDAITQKRALDLSPDFPGLASQ